MFKIVILQQYYSLSDDQLEYQVVDRLSFRRFLGLCLEDRVPDAKTLWAFKNKLAKEGLDKEIFGVFDEKLRQEGLIGQKGKIVDASFVEAPRQRNTKEENATVKKGEIPEEWKKNKNKMRQKDVDARWTKKGEETHYGYKNHVKVEQDHKLIEDYMVTSAEVHDSQALDALLPQSGESLYADSAYKSEKTCEGEGGTCFRIYDQHHRFLAAAVHRERASAMACRHDESGLQHGEV